MTSELLIAEHQRIVLFLSFGRHIENKSGFTVEEVHY